MPEVLPVLELSPCRGVWSGLAFPAWVRIMLVFETAPRAEPSPERAVVWGLA